MKSKDRAQISTARKEAIEANRNVQNIEQKIRKELYATRLSFQRLIIRLRFLGLCFLIIGSSYDYLAELFCWQHQWGFGGMQMIIVVIGIALFILGWFK